MPKPEPKIKFDLAACAMSYHKRGDGGAIEACLHLSFII